MDDRYRLVAGALPSRIDGPFGGHIVSVRRNSAAKIHLVRQAPLVDRSRTSRFGKRVRAAPWFVRGLGRTPLSRQSPRYRYSSAFAANMVGRLENGPIPRA